MTSGNYGYQDGLPLAVNIVSFVKDENALVPGQFYAFCGLTISFSLVKRQAFQNALTSVMRRRLSEERGCSHRGSPDQQCFNDG